MFGGSVLIELLPDIAMHRPRMSTLVSLQNTFSLSTCN